MIPFGRFLALLGSPVLMATLHAILVRVSPRPPRQAMAAASGLLTSLLFALRAGSADEALFTFVACLLFAHVYFHLFNMSETARRIRLLVDWKLGRPTRESYSAEGMVRVRLARLVELRQVTRRGDRYFSRRSLLRMVARAFAWHERLLFPTRE